MKPLPVLRIVLQAGVTVPAVLVDPDLSRAIMQSGTHNPGQFNAISWPLGAHRYASGHILITRRRLDFMRKWASDNTSRLNNISIEIGDVDAPVTLTGMAVLQVEPVLVSGTGIRLSDDAEVGDPIVALYALQVVCRRHAAAAVMGDTRFNMTDASRTGLTDTNGGTAWTSDDVASALITDSGLPAPTITDVDIDAYPIDVDSVGLSVTRALDRVLAESGRVYVLKPDGTATIELIDRWTCSDVIGENGAKIMAGLQRYAAPTGTGTVPGAWATRVTLPDTWAEEEVPESVEVWMADSAGDPPGYTSNTVTLASTGLAGLVAATGSTRPLYDNYAEVESGAVLARADYVALNYYRRHRVGSMDVVLAGIVNPTMGGATQVVTWSTDAIMGPRTRVQCSIDWAGYPWTRHHSVVEPGLGMVAIRQPHGDVRLAPGATSSWWARITSSAPDIANLTWTYGHEQMYLSNDAYDWDVVSGGVTGTTSTDPARALFEAANVSGGVISGSIDIGGASYPAGFMPQPVAVNTIVRMYAVTVPPEGTNAGETFYWFDSGHTAHDGDCSVLSVPARSESIASFIDQVQSVLVSKSGVVLSDKRGDLRTTKSYTDAFDSVTAMTTKRGELLSNKRGEAIVPKTSVDPRDDWTSYIAFNKEGVAMVSKTGTAMVLKGAA